MYPRLLCVEIVRSDGGFHVGGCFTPAHVGGNPFGGVACAQVGGDAAGGLVKLRGGAAVGLAVPDDWQWDGRGWAAPMPADPAAYAPTPEDAPA